MKFGFIGQALFLFQQKLADNAQIVKYPQAQGQQGHIIQVNAQPVPHLYQEGRQKGVGEKAGDKDLVVKSSLAGCSQAAKDGVQ